MRTKAMQQIPAEALPQLPAGGLTEAPRQPRIVTARDESREESGPRYKILSDSSRRDWCRTSDPYRVNSIQVCSPRFLSVSWISDLNQFRFEAFPERSGRFTRSGEKSGEVPQRVVGRVFGGLRVVTWVVNVGHFSRRI